MARTRAALLLLAIAAPARGEEKPGGPDAAGYAKTVAPFLKQYCNSCHVGEKAKGDFRVDPVALPNDFLDPTAAARWHEVVNVLDGHEMPPKGAKPQPTAAEVAAVVEWARAQAVRAELARRGNSVTLRRLNRAEYRNTVRDLCGVDFDSAVFPQDPPAGGFDNNGGALSMSPLQVEMYLDAARVVLDRALVEGDRPATIRWKFVPKVCPPNTTRVKLGPNNDPLVNGGTNRQEGEWVVMRTFGWDKSVNALDFKVPAAGEYAIRVTAAGRTPTRADVVKMVDGELTRRRNEETSKNPGGAAGHKVQYDRDLAHFKTDRIYDYGPPRVKLVVQLGPQPRTVAEFDAPAAPDKPQVHEFRTRFTTENAQVSFIYDYTIPRVLENFWLQDRETFPRPELMISTFEIEGPLHATWPPPSHTGILFDSPLRRSDERAYAAAVLARFMRKAYRRPVAPGEVSAKMALYDSARRGKATFVEAIKRPLTAVLVSPHFLFLVEPAGESRPDAPKAEGPPPDPAKPYAPRPLTDHELAARMSYFAWSSMPDAELTKLAEAGKLRDKEERLRQIDRLFADPKRESFVRNFAGQWLGLREVGSNPPAPDLFPQYDRHLELSMVGEGEAFFRTVLDGDLPVRNFIKSDFVVVNERLARFYGIPGVRGDEFRKVPLPKGVRRGGVATMAAVLTITSNGTRTSPVKRGTWVMKTLLGTDPGLPLANAGEIAPKVPGVDKATVRKRLEIHRSLAQCARCHNKIDPLGFALENFNAAGEWREQEGFGYKGRIDPGDPKIDASAQMPDGAKIVGVDGLQAALLRQEDLFLKALASKVLTYALGRELGVADRPTVAAAVAHMKANGRTLKSLIRFAATCEPFETK